MIPAVPPVAVHGGGRYPDHTGFVHLEATARGEPCGHIRLFWYSWGDQNTQPTILLMHARTVCYQSGRHLTYANMQGVSAHGWDAGDIDAAMATQLADRGYHVLMFDHRDVGRSTKLPAFPPVSNVRACMRMHWCHSAGNCTISQSAFVLAKFAGRRARSNGYELEDMARDAIGLLDALHVDRFHVGGALRPLPFNNTLISWLAGFSMGGMLAQLLAIEYPGRVLSLVSIASTADHPGAKGAIISCFCPKIVL
jgi:pimeloyl-ACP methyl ester carboxylesterase